MLAAFTTAHARLHLYATLERLDARVLDFDADSIIYQHVEGLLDPTFVNKLGGWADELDGDRIIKLTSRRSKNYVFETDQGNTVQKVKGITRNYRASQCFVHNAMHKTRDSSTGRGVSVA